MLSETNLIETLHRHGLALSPDDLHTLRNFIKPSEASEQSSALGSDSILNGLKGGAGMLKAPAATVSLTLGNGQVIQLTEPFPETQQQQRVQFVTTPFDSQATQVFQAAPVAQQHAEVVQNHGFQNEFLEDLARSQIVSDPKKKTPVRVNTPANTNNNAPKKKPEPRKKKPTPGKVAQTVVVNLSSQTATPTNANTVPRVQTIKLSPQNQQVNMFFYKLLCKPSRNCFVPTESAQYPGPNPVPDVQKGSNFTGHFFAAEIDRTSPENFGYGKTSSHHSGPACSGHSIRKLTLIFSVFLHVPA